MLQLGIVDVNCIEIIPLHIMISKLINYKYL